MTALVNVVIHDGATVPVAHTFKPVGLKDDIARYNDVATGVPIGFGRLSVSLRQPLASNKPGANSKSSVYRAVFKLDIPILELTSPSTGSGIQPAPTVAYTSVFTGEFVIPARSSLQERKDILAYAKNLLANALATSVVVDLESVY